MTAIIDMKLRYKMVKKTIGKEEDYRILINKALTRSRIKTNTIPETLITTKEPKKFKPGNLGKLLTDMHHYSPLKSLGKQFKLQKFCLAEQNQVWNVSNWVFDKPFHD